MRLISSGAESARMLYEKGLLTPGGGVEYYVSDAPERFSRVASWFLERPIDGQVHYVEIDKY